MVNVCGEIQPKKEVGMSAKGNDKLELTIMGSSGYDWELIVIGVNASDASELATGTRVLVFGAQMVQAEGEARVMVYDTSFIAEYPKVLAEAGRAATIRQDLICSYAVLTCWPRATYALHDRIPPCSAHYCLEHAHTFYLQRITANKVPL